MKKSKFLKIIFLVLFALLFVVSAFKIATYFYEQHISKKLYDDVASTAIVNQTENDTDDENKFTLFDVDFDGLKSKNEDVVGWIYLPDTPINYPVLQGDDNDQYLRRLLDGRYNQDGSIFVDYRNAELNEDMNYIMYGHNMKSGTMFTYIEKYMSQEFFDANPVIYYLTPECKYIINLYAGFVATTDSETYYINQEESKFTEYMNNAKLKSTFKSDVEYTHGQTVVTLSTCYSKNDRYRYVVLGILEEYKP